MRLLALDGHLLISGVAAAPSSTQVPPSLYESPVSVRMRDRTPGAAVVPLSMITGVGLCVRAAGRRPLYIQAGSTLISFGRRVFETSGFF